MKKIFLLAFAVALFSCEKESNLIETTPETAVDKVATVMALEANPDLDNASEGLYKGIFASYDLELKGLIFINLANNDKYEAAVKFHRGTSFVQKIYFEGRPHPTEANVVIFESTLGTFNAEVSSAKQITVNHFTFNGRDTYIAAFKATRGGDVTFSMGTYVDDLDPAYSGNWDAVHTGQTATSTSDQHTPAGSGVLSLLDKVVVTRGPNMNMSTDTPADNDSFLEPCFYEEVRGPFPHAWYFDEPGPNGYREFIGYNQTTTLQGKVASWTLSYYFLNSDGNYYYDTPSCGTPASSGTGFGTWSWDGRSGKLFVDELFDLPI